MKGIIFDCNGVLVDSEPISCKAWIEALSHHNVHTDETEINTLIGRSAKKILQYFTEKNNLPLPESILEKYI
ncbi:HAD family phosphatase [Clostridium sp. DJ247]|uniref:HAD family hydrolase n=1 Tax=Clostridium sp. DJ247 TaxID=2726188 RepID=UPI001626797B|nr:HAD hydrolase-like protein [Clostridium sp. DJ247]MBC2582559.1 HAD family phosphatase [Clostridium sp. DJ247]